MKKELRSHQTQFWITLLFTYTQLELLNLLPPFYLSAPWFAIKFRLVKLFKFYGHGHWFRYCGMTLIIKMSLGWTGHWYFMDNLSHFVFILFCFLRIKEPWNEVQNIKNRKVDNLFRLLCPHLLCFCLVDCAASLLEQRWKWSSIGRWQRSMLPTLLWFSFFIFEIKQLSKERTRFFNS